MPILIPTRSNDSRHTRALIRAMLCVALTLVAACSGSRQSQQEDDSASDASSPSSSSESTAQSDTTEFPDQTLGERLGRLDALMKTAPPDSLELLAAEYRRLLNDAGYTDEQILTGDPSIDIGGIESEVRRDTAEQRERMRGFRRSELEETDGDMTSSTGVPSMVRRTTGEGTTTAKTTTARKSSKQTASMSARREVVERAEEPGPAPSAARNRDAMYVNGLAASKAGRHAEAAEKLPPVVASPPPGKRRVAEYAYGESLEKTGKLEKAAETYRKSSGGNEELAHKSYISYCRVLAKSGKREEARKLLAQFISRNPKSKQVVNARQLLQTL